MIIRVQSKKLELNESEIKQGFKIDAFGRKYRKGNVHYKIHGRKRTKFKIKHNFKEGVDYKRYLQSYHWQQLRRSFLKKHPFCYICRGINQLEVHHLTYYRDGKSILGREVKKDLCVLCRVCHQSVHDKGIAFDFKRIIKLKNEKKTDPNTT